MLLKCNAPYEGEERGRKAAGGMNAAVDHAKAQLWYLAFLTSSLTLYRCMRRGSCFHRAVQWKPLLTESATFLS